MQEAVCVLNSEHKKVLIIDIIEDPQKVARMLNKLSVLRHIAEENSKAEINLELTTKELTDLGLLRVVERKPFVRSLNLSENALVALRDLKDFTGVQELNLRDNLIESIREVLYLSHLQYLDLHHNRLAGKLPRMDFPSLKTLDISQNELTDVSSLSDSKLENLAVLFISHNRLTELPVLVCPHLEKYFFSHNLIDNLENFVLSRIRGIRKIYGYNNLVWGELPELNLPHL